MHLRNIFQIEKPVKQRLLESGYIVSDASKSGAKRLITDLDGLEIGWFTAIKSVELIKKGL